MNTPYPLACSSVNCGSFKSTCRKLARTEMRVEVGTDSKERSSCMILRVCLFAPALKIFCIRLSESNLELKTQAVTERFEMF